jgi:hypothetical protein
MEWISVDHRLPEGPKLFPGLSCVVLGVAWGCVATVLFCPVVKKWAVPNTDLQDAPVTHWMPLPEPPR